MLTPQEMLAGSAAGQPLRLVETLNSNAQNKRAAAAPKEDTSSRGNTRVTADDIDQLFDEMASCFGAKFTSQWGEFDEGSRWLGELQHLSRMHLERGLSRIRTAIRDAARSGDECWPPQPLAFAAMCEPRAEDYGMPAPDEAWAEVSAHAHDPAGHQWSHEAVRRAGAAVGWWDLMHCSPSRVRRLEDRFTREYEALVNRVMNGDDLTPRNLLQHDGGRSPAELAERAGREVAQRMTEADGLPHSVNASQGLAMLRAAARRAGA